jgi:hypothetical protein
MSQYLIGILIGLVLLKFSISNLIKTRRFNLIFNALIVDNLSLNIIKQHNNHTKIMYYTLKSFETII